MESQFSEECKDQRNGSVYIILNNSWRSTIPEKKKS